MAMYNSINNVSLTMTGGKILGNSAKIGGGIYLAGDSVNVPDSMATKPDEEKHGPILVVTSEAGSSVEISGNTATLCGGGMFFGQGTLAKLERVKMVDNSATGETTSVTGTDLSGYAQADLFEGSGGALMAVRKTSVTISNCIIGEEGHPNVAVATARGGIGGGLCFFSENNWKAYAAAKANISRSTIAYNSARNGGGIGTVSGTYRETANRSILQIADTEIAHNSANGNGGGVFLRNDTFYTMTGGSIKDNTATGDGGGIYSNSSFDDRVVLDHVRVTGNTSSGNGGGARAHFISLLNGTRITGNTVEMKKDNNNRPDIRKGGGLYMVAGTLTLGGDTEEIRIDGNHARLTDYDIAPYPSDLRLADKKDTNGNDKTGDNQPTSVKLTSYFRGKIRVVNPGTLYSDFGTSENWYLYDSSNSELWENAAIVSQNGSKLYGRIKANDKGGSGYLLYWWQEYVCKITDADGNMLYKADRTPAVYMRLYEQYNKLNSAFGTLNDADNKFYVSGEEDSAEYTGSVFCVKMLTNFDLMEPVLIGDPVSDRTITLETAEPYPDRIDDYYFRGGYNDTAVIKPGPSMTNDTNAFMFRVQRDIQMTFKNITLDGGAKYYEDANGNLQWNSDGSPRIDMNNSFISSKDGVLIQMSGTADVTLGGWNEKKQKWETTTLQNAYTTHQYGGGAICFGATDGARSMVINEGTTIRRCCAAFTHSYDLAGDHGGYGGAISFYRGYGTRDELTILGGVIEECWAAEKGGAIFIPNNAEVVAIKGGEIRNCHAPVGGGIYMDDRASGGDYTPVVASSLSIEGEISFSDNYGTNYNLKGKVNGGDAQWYEKGWARQDIYVAAFPWQNWNHARIDPVKPIIVTGPITAEPGSIRVWVEEDVHDATRYPFMGYHYKDQFAVFDNGVKEALEAYDSINNTTVLQDSIKAFRDARPDTDTLNTTSGYLTGILGDESTETPGVVKNTVYIYWGPSVSGSRKVILRKVLKSVYTPLDGRTFKIHQGSLTGAAVKGTDINGVENVESFISGESGVFYIGELNYGTYYIEETGVAGYFILTVDESGVGYYDGGSYSNELEKQST